MKKKSAGRLFLAIFFKSILMIAILLAVGFGSYKGVLFYYSYKEQNQTGKKTNTIEEGEKLDQEITALYGDDSSTNSIDYMMLRIFNGNTANEDYIVIPSNTKVTIPDSLYQELSAKVQEIPQEILLKDIGTYFNDSKERYEMTTKVLAGLTGQTIDHYIAVNQSSFVSVINLLPPQSVNVPIDMTFKDDSGINVELKKGEQSLNGQQVLGLVTNLEGYSDGEMGRVSACITYFKKYEEAKHSLESEDELAQYLEKYYELVISDNTYKNAQKYLDNYYMTKADQVYFHVLKGLSQEDTYEVSDVEIQTQIKTILSNSAYTKAQEDETLSPTAQVTSSKALNIAVYNSTKVNGLAGKWKEKLTTEGFKVSSVNTERSGVLENTKIVVRTEGTGQDLLPYFQGASIETGELPQGTDIKIVLGSADAF